MDTPKRHISLIHHAKKLLRFVIYGAQFEDKVFINSFGGLESENKVKNFSS
jgi:hypothetical protein